ncbi:MAG: sulfotransferase family protein [Flavobacteriales bacterium]|jgi:hypothetical protein|tara:strand:+ start:80 stop:970 length:891 start_codon:yes stop_codon:yes gene_type:complete
MILPNLLIVGAAKSGTTSLHNYLKQHSDIFMSDHKEPHFFINNEIGTNRIPNGISKYDDYIALFKNSESYKYRGESSTMYLQFPDISIKNINKYLNDDVKIIIMLRNPIERAFSGYQHVKRYNVMENLDFEDAIKQCENRYFINTNFTPASRYINIGLYYNMVKKFQANFGENMHIVIYDDFIADTQNELSKIFSFLNISDFVINTNEKYMVGGWQWKNSFLKKLFLKKNLLNKFIRFILPFQSFKKILRNRLVQVFSTPVVKMKDTTKSSLQNLYKEDLKKLSTIIDRDLKIWLK